MKNKKRSKAKRPNLSNAEQAAASSRAAEIRGHHIRGRKMLHRHTAGVASSTNVESKQTTAGSSVNSPTAEILTMFDSAQHIHIMGGSFVNGTNVKIRNGPSSDVLYKRVAPNAILNAGGHADEVRCYPGTREEVISCIEKWGGAQDNQSTPMFWLSGPAGAGKSAIMQTIAKRCKEHGVPQANFFIFRGDPSRSHASPFIVTLLHQIILLYPSLRDQVETILTTNPLIFDCTLEDQVEQLIVTPLRSIPQPSSTYRPFLLIIDGLDECDSETKLSQEQILRAFDKTLTRHNKACPFRVLVASCDESQIQMAFNQLSSECLHLYLDETYSPESDIRLFVEARFAEVRKAHRLARMLSANWPSVNDVDYIVEKSSGQFIFAATVMHFIIGSSASPVVSLQRIRGVTPLASKSPFAHLDAIYTYILSQVDDQEVLKDMLAVQLLLRAAKDDIAASNGRILQNIDIRIIELMGGLNPRYDFEIIFSCLEDLTPLIKYNSQSGELLFHHASFSDHLLDQSRSGDYFVDTAAFTHKILPQIWKDSDHGQRRESWVAFSLHAINRLQRLPPGVMSLLTSSVKKTQIPMDASHALCYAIAKIFKLCIHDDEIIGYRHFLRACINRHTLDRYETEEINAIPFGDWYYQMARAQRFLALDFKIANTLHPKSEFDCQELASLLTELFNCIRKETCTSDHECRRYQKEWSAWADSNGVPCHDS